MIRRLLALAAALALAGCGAPEQPWPPPSPALWEVTGEDGTRGWLFGTIHALPDGVEWRTPAFERAFAGAGTLVVEIENLADHSGSSAFEDAATSPGLRPLLQRLPPADRPGVLAAMERGDYEEADFARYETWAAALIIANGASTADTENGVDRALLERDKPVAGLETFARQFAIFDRLSAQDQADLLRLTAEKADAADQRASETAWLTGDLTTLEHKELAGVMADAGLRDALVLRRNRAWAGRIAELIAAGRKPFVAVGAGHMLTSDGLPALLAARGYTVRRIQ